MESGITYIGGQYVGAPPHDHDHERNHGHNPHLHHPNHPSHYPAHQPSIGISQGQDPNSSATSSEGSSTSPPPAAYSGEQAQPVINRRIGAKNNVTSACVPCKRAHLACDVSRPCKRCTSGGKEDSCQDMPHKKRGRPRVPKASLGVPYSRNRLPSMTDSALARTQLANHYPDAQPYPSTSLRIDPSHASTYTSSLATPTYPAPPLFTVFTTTDLRVLRCTPGSYNLIGYHPQDFINTSLIEWVISHDRPLLEMEVGRLMTNPMSPGLLHTSRETQEAVAHRSEEELMSPVEGMRDPYPNQNVRIMRADQQYSLFNVRLHLGGGLGGSLWHPETSGRVYFVISLLLLPPPPPTPASSTWTSNHLHTSNQPRLSINGHSDTPHQPTLAFRPPSIPHVGSGSGSSGHVPQFPSGNPPAGQSSQYHPVSQYHSPGSTPGPRLSYPPGPGETMIPSTLPRYASDPNYPYSSSASVSAQHSPPQGQFPHRSASDPHIQAYTTEQLKKEGYALTPQSRSFTHAHAHIQARTPIQSDFDQRLMQAYPGSGQVSPHQWDAVAQANGNGHGGQGERQIEAATEEQMANEGNANGDEGMRADQELARHREVVEQEYEEYKPEAWQLAGLSDCQ